MTDKLCRNLTAGFTAFAALITYVITVAPTVSFWDCGEFIASAHTLGIPHPPGRPFFIIFVRAVMLLLPMVEEIAKRANYISAFASAATVYLTVIFVWTLLSKLVKNVSLSALIPASASAGLLLMFSDTFWFNAVEAEVYNLIMFVILLYSYIALLYLDCKDEGQKSRYLILICYLAFLGIGFHLFSMLAVPAVFALVLLAEGNIRKAFDRWPLWISGTILCSAVYAISYFLSFAVFLLIILFAALFAAKNSPLRKDISLSLVLTIVALLGFSTHLYIPVRSSLDPVIDENDPEINIRDKEGKLLLTSLLPFERNGNWLNVTDANGNRRLGNFLPFKENESWRAFYDYLERKQYGSESMIARSFYRRSQIENQFLVFPHMGYGSYQIAQYTPFKPGEVSYNRPGIYTIDAERNPPVVRGFAKFPTLMMSIGENKPIQAVIFLIFNGLLLWTIAIAFKRNRNIGIYIALLYGLCSFGLLWYLNFSDGTKLERRDHEVWLDTMNYYTNQLASRGAINGVIRVPDPNELLNVWHKIVKGDKNAAQNGAWQSWERIQAAFVSAGLSKPALPEPVHLEVRNRDYFYTPAFVFMSLIYGIGIGFLLLHIQKRRANLFLPSGIAIAALCGAVPLFANYKEHNRGNLWIPKDYAYNLLMSCEPNAILFTNGDNDTFPLWFAQEVAGIRKDVRVVNLSLGNTDWYIKQMLDNPPLLKIRPDDPRFSPEENKARHKTYVDNELALSESNYNEPSHRVGYWVDSIAGVYIPRLVRDTVILSIRLESAATAADTAKIQADLDRRKLALQVYTALKEWGEPRRESLMQTQYKLVVVLALNNPDKPIHVSTTVGLSNAVGLDKYMVQKGMVWDLIKGSFTPTNNEMDIDKTTMLVDSVFKYRGLGDGTVYVPDETKQLLYIYNQIYFNLAMSMKDVNKALRYLDMGISQFPEELRHYAIAHELLKREGDNARAIEYLEKGIRETSDGSGKKYLQQLLDGLKLQE